MVRSTVVLLWLMWSKAGMNDVTVIGIEFFAISVDNSPINDSLINAPPPLLPPFGDRCKR